MFGAVTTLFDQATRICSRATHGIVDAVMSLRNKHGFAAEGVEKVTARVPPLVV